MRQRDLDGVDGADQVGVDDVGPGLHRRIALHARDACLGDDDVQAAELRDAVLERLLQLRCITAQVDVRVEADLRAALEAGLVEFGKLDIVVAQAGVAAMKGQPSMQAWTDGINTNFVGTINAIQVALPHLKEGASIIATASAAALMDAHSKPNPGADPGGMGYMVSKRLISEYVHALATELAVRGIRANVIHPTNCNTNMLQSEPMYRSFRPDLENPTRADAEPVFGVQQAMKVNFIEPEDISNAVLWLASEESRYVTGMQLRVDAGGYLKWYDYHK